MMFGLVDFFDSAIPCRGNKPIKIGISTFIAQIILPHHPDSEKFRESVVETTVVKLLRFYEVVLKLLWRTNSYPTGDHPDNR
jgi:hypothetical protein